MEMQNQIKEYVALYESEVRKLADQLRNESMPQLTEELFSEFETNGNRMRYEAVYFGRRKFLSVLGLASVIWHGKEDIQKLEEVIREICAEECWALPAHVRRKENPNWRGVIDLFASETGQALAHLTTLLKDELSEEVQGVKFGKLNVDENMGLAQKFRVMSIPTLILFKNGEEVKRFIGLQTKDTLKALLDAE